MAPPPDLIPSHQAAGLEMGQLVCRCLCSLGMGIKRKDMMVRFHMLLLRILNPIRTTYVAD